MQDGTAPLRALIDPRLLGEALHSFPRGRRGRDLKSLTSLMRLVEAVVLYDQLLLPDVNLAAPVIGRPRESDTGSQRMLLDGSVLIRVTSREAGPLYREVVARAESMYPKRFARFQSMPRGEGYFESFFENIHQVALSRSLETPLISSVSDDVTSILIRRSLVHTEAASIIHAVYELPADDLHDSLQPLLRLRGLEGIPVSPIAFRWLDFVVDRDVWTIDDMLTVALEMRSRFSKVREHLRELAAALDGPSASILSRNRAAKRVAELRRALGELAQPDSERIFLIRALDATTLLPAVNEIAASGDIASIVRQLGGKQLSWWARRLRYGAAFQLFASFDEFVNNTRLAHLVSRYFPKEIEPSELQWVRHHSEELRNINRLRLLTDDEDPWLVASDVKP